MCKYIYIYHLALTYICYHCLSSYSSLHLARSDMDPVLVYVPYYIFPSMLEYGSVSCFNPQKETRYEVTRIYRHQWANSNFAGAVSHIMAAEDCLKHIIFKQPVLDSPDEQLLMWYVYWTNDVDLLKDDNLAQMLSNLCKWETWMQEWRVDKEFRPTQMHPSIPRIPFLCQHRGICETSLYQQLLCAKHVGLHVILRPYCSWQKIWTGQSASQKYWHIELGD